MSSQSSGNIRMDRAMQCRYCNRTTRNPDLWCRICRGPNKFAGSPNTSSASSLTTKSLLDTMVRKRKSPRPEQSEDRDLLIEELYDNEADRAQIRAACGMGKTITAQLVIDEMSKRVSNERGDAGRFVVACPTIELARQLREDYINDGIVDPECLSIHDDSADFKNEDTKDKDQEEALEKFFDEDSYGNPKIIFAVATPTSLGKIAAAQRSTGSRLDGAIFDEAHNLGGDVLRKKKKDGALSDRPRVFFDDEDDSLLVDKRVFMTATPRTDTPEQPFSGYTASNASSPEDSRRDAYMRIMSGSTEDSVYLSQNDERFFGKMVSSRSYAEAVAAGYLNPIDAVEEKSLLKNPSNLAIHRGGVVDITSGTYKGDRTYNSRLKKQKANKLEDNEMTVGAYQSTCSIIRDLSTDQSGSSNVLSFSDTIEESQQIADKRKFGRIANMLASQELGGKKAPTLTEAKRALSARSRASESEKRAARMVLVGKYANLMSTSSKDKPEDQRRATSFLDKTQPGEDSPATMWIDGWNPAPKVLCNVDRLSEGVNIPSVDRVVLSRPGNSSDAAIYQAAGRASRKWDDEDGNSKKPKGKIIVPSLEEIDGSGRRRDVLTREKAVTMRALADIYYDSGSEDWRNTASAEKLDDSKKLNVVSGGSTTDIREYAKKSMDSARQNLPLETMDAMVKTYNKARKEAQRNATSAKWLKMGSSEREQYVQMALMSMASKNVGKQKIDLGNAEPFIATAIGKNAISNEDISAFRTVLDDAYRRQHQNASLDDEESTFINKRKSASTRKKFHSQTASTDEILRGLVNSKLISASDF